MPGWSSLNAKELNMVIRTTNSSWTFRNQLHPTPLYLTKHRQPSEMPRATNVFGRHFEFWNDHTRRLETFKSVDHFRYLIHLYHRGTFRSWLLPAGRPAALHFRRRNHRHSHWSWWAIPGFLRIPQEKWLRVDLPWCTSLILVLHMSIIKLSRKNAQKLSGSKVWSRGRLLSPSFWSVHWHISLPTVAFHFWVSQYL